MTENEEAASSDAEAEADADTEAAPDDEESESETGEKQDQNQDQESGLQEDDFVRLAYTARTVEDGELVDTTDRETAEESDIDTEDRTFEPRTLVLGAGQLFESVEEDVVGRAVGDEGSVVVPAAEAFGEYDESEVRTISADRIPEDSRYPGAHVDIDNQHGHVQTIVGGRARVDFNHPLAGEDIEYEYEILGKVEDRVEQAQGLMGTYFDVDLEMRIETDEVEEETETEEGETETETVEKETLYIESNPQLQFNQQWMFSKQQIAQDIIDRIGVDRVIIQETIEGQAAGPMGGMGGMMGGAGGGDLGELEEAMEDTEVDADEIVEELEGDLDEE
jgi:FKBP-type peptidyl-prolyl cis-trans isomerase SlyD